MAAGCDDHPSTPTALQVYRILSLCHFLMPKPSKYGNCSNDQSNIRMPSIIKLHDIKEIYKRPENKRDKSRYEILKEQIDTIVNSKHSEAVEEDIFNIISAEHDYGSSGSSTESLERDSILYFAAAKICKRLCETAPVKDCDTCQKALLDSRPENLNSKELGLEEVEVRYQPHENIFNIIKQLNSYVELHKDKVNVAELVLLEAAKHEVLSFSCTSHAKFVMEFTLESFVSTKLLKIASDKTTQQKKESMKMKKLARLTGF